MSQAASGRRARDQRPAEGRFLAWGRKRYIFHKLDASVSWNSANDQV